MKISLRKKKLKSGKLSLYIEYYKGSLKDKDGKEKHNRQFDYLNLYLLEDPKTADEKRSNKETLELAENILALKKSDFLTGKFNLVDKQKGKVRLYDYFEIMKEKRSSYISNYGTWVSVKRYLDLFFHPTITLNEITPKLLEDFKLFLDVEAKTKYGQPLKHGTKYSYFNRMKAVINSAYEEGYITDVKVVKVKSFEEKETQREYLTFEELKKLGVTECKYPILKQAFIFSCVTGLRWSDIHKLKWSEVRDTEDSSMIVFTQQKTQELEYLFISDHARSLLGERSKTNDRVFTGLIYNIGITNELLRWCMRAGINKHITFHCARHTAATLLLNKGADLFSVMKRLGHKDIRTTQIYAKITDKKKKETANLISSFEVNL